MLNKHYASVLTLAILLTLGITPKSIATSYRAKFYSSFGDKLTTLEEDILISSSNLADNIGRNKTKNTIVAQDTSNSGTSTEQKQPVALWWLVPLIILVPFLGWLLLKPGSSSNTQQTEEKLTKPQDLTDTTSLYSPTSQDTTSESSVDSNFASQLTREEADAEIETAQFSNFLDDNQEQVEDINNAVANLAEIQGDRDLQQPSAEDDRSCEESIPSEDMVDSEKIVDEPLSSSIAGLTDVNSENVETSQVSEPQIIESTVEAELTQSTPDALIELEEVDNSQATEFVAEAELTQSTPDLFAESEETSAEITPEQIEKITDRELANISEWLNERIDSTDEDISSIDDLWDNFPSANEEIDQQNVNSSEVSNKDSNLNNITQDSFDNLLDVVEGREPNLNEQLLDNNLNLLGNKDKNVLNSLDSFTNRASDSENDNFELFDLEEEQNPTRKTTEGINDATSNLLEELLNEDSNQERQH